MPTVEQLPSRHRAAVPDALPLLPARLGTRWHRAGIRRPATASSAACGSAEEDARATLVLPPSERRSPFETKRITRIELRLRVTKPAGYGKAAPAGQVASSKHAQAILAMGPDRSVRFALMKLSRQAPRALRRRPRFAKQGGFTVSVRRAVPRNPGTKDPRSSRDESHR